MTLSYRGITITRDELIQVAVIMGAALGLGIGLRILIRQLLSMASIRERPWARALIGPLSSLTFWGLLLLGVNFAFDGIEAFSTNAKLSHNEDVILGLASIFYMAACGVKFTVAFYRIEVARVDGSDPSRINRLLLVRRLVTAGVVVLAAMFALKVVGVDTSPFLAGGAFGGVIIGLALQQSLANVFSGLLFAWDASIRIGDLIRLSNGKEGFVKNVGWRSASLRMLDNSMLVIPNSVLAGDTIVNLSRPKLLVAVNLDWRVAADSDLEAVEEIVLTVAGKVQSAHQGEYELGPPKVSWRDAAGGGILFRIHMPIPSSEVHEGARSDLIKAVQKALKGADVVTITT